MTADPTPTPEQPRTPTGLGAVALMPGALDKEGMRRLVVAIEREAQARPEQDEAHPYEKEGGWGGERMELDLADEAAEQDEAVRLPDWTCGYLLGHVNAPGWAGRGPSPCALREGHSGDHAPLYRLATPPPATDWTEPQHPGYGYDATPAALDLDPDSADGRAERMGLPPYDSQDAYLFGTGKPPFAPASPPRRPAINLW